MKKFMLLTLPLVLAACASQSPTLQDVEAPVSAEQQRAAQQAAAAPTRLALKRKIAVGRLSNETTYGRSLLGTNAGDNIDQKITDMFVQSLINSNNYLVFERPDIELLERESELSGQSVNIIGVDTLVIGSLTEFGRSTTGESGFLSSSKRQEATATVDLRLVDTRTGQVTESVTGTGSSSTETGSTMGFGSVASYDGSLNDQAIGAAVNAAVEKLTLLMLEKPWSADVLAVEDGLIYISGGASQGIRAGMVFDVMTRGREVTSQTTGGIITLPGNKVGELRIDGTFGDSELEEGAYGGLISGSIAGQDLNQLEVREAN
ncbi:curli production assembly protein CsgG [Saccharospirillum sp. MSK14-1]|uniref:CsgG/HfaB family protein n=1 Tax=Saccharospirillum sp. MSK14-1 TaxID=1897632 RepID=UPI000D37AC82|nr:CsgG/HfaB family protein [Saccharospirillum sp. MSK14-1]PTY37977.1 curli production assembly protein CsgG [Saccharospirillum sp. MSK14-1]